MTRIFSDYTYGNGPRDGCWWDETCDLPHYPKLETDIHCDVAIIGAGFTGLNTALKLAEAGVDVVLLDAQYVGWGASGRNGGFCCLGGGKISDAQLDRRYGKPERLVYRATEKAAVDHVAELIARFDLDVDKHSNGETQLAHRPRDLRDMEADAERIIENYGVVPVTIRKNELQKYGMTGPFYGAQTIPIGFGLNPRKYVVGLAKAAVKAGVRIFANTPVRSLQGTHLQTPHGCVRAENVVIATNGYSSETLSDWLAGRYLPAQSSVLVTRVLTKPEQEAQGWTTGQMTYDTRHLLHYFRLMPDGRMLFGMRGGLRSSPSAEAQARRATHRAFKKMFPTWADVEVTHTWSGLVCMARNLLPFVGPVPDQPSVFASLCYHGNGVAMGSFCGAQLADLILGKSNEKLPRLMQNPLGAFPLGRMRRLLMPPAYLGYALSDL